MSHTKTLLLQQGVGRQFKSSTNINKIQQNFKNQQKVILGPTWRGFGEALGSFWVIFALPSEMLLQKQRFRMRYPNFLNLNFEDVSSENATFETKCRKVVQILLNIFQSLPKASPKPPRISFLGSGVPRFKSSKIFQTI